MVRFSVKYYIRVLDLQERAVRVMNGLKTLDSCRPVFKIWKTSTAVSLYVWHSIMLVTYLTIRQYS